MTDDARCAFRRIGILHHPRKPDSLDLAGQMEQFLRRAGVNETWRHSAWDAEVVKARLPDVMLGVKMGRLGFLAEIFPQDWRSPLEKLLQGDYWIEERLMVRTLVEKASPNGGEPLVRCTFDALNDVVVSRGSLARIVRVSANLDGGYLTTYTCDGLIVSTATGSTAYALAAGGPILPPDLRNILVIPVAPHMSMDRAVVLSEGTEVRLRVYSDHSAMLTVDGQFEVEVDDSDEIVVASSPYQARFVRLRPRSYFYQTLMDKLK